MVETARLLLELGADPNSCYLDPRWQANALPCLYEAIEINNSAELGSVLLKAGAQPNDGESLYHSTEHPDLTCLKMMLEHGAIPTGSNALKHILDYESVEGVKLLLAAGAVPNELNERAETALHWAVLRGRSAGIVAQLLDANVHIDARRTDDRTAYALAAISGQGETVTLLRERGADQSLAESDALVAACSGEEQPEIERWVATAKRPLPAKYQHFLAEFAGSHRIGAVRALLALGVPVDSRGAHGGTALHWACWKGYTDLVTILIQNGASLSVQDFTFHATLTGWFVHGLRNSVEKSHYPKIARLLLAAGAEFAPSDLPTGDAAVDAVLREHSLLRE